MKFLLTNSLFALLLAFSVFSCSQTVATPKAPVAAASDFQFDTGARVGGTAFYSMNTYTGEISYMVDFGEEAGQWFNYGDAIQALGNRLILRSIDSENGVTFYAMDSGTGQLYYMMDHGNTPAQWQKFGGMIRQNGLNMMQFDMISRTAGPTFYAYDSFTHQTYYLNLTGDSAGKWNSYGKPFVGEGE